MSFLLSNNFFSFVPMTSRSTTIWRTVAVLAAALILLLAVPQKMRSSLPWVLGSADFHLGLDLAGGTQLDFRISEAEIDAQEKLLKAQAAKLSAGSGSTEELNSVNLELQIIQQQRQNLVEAIRTVLERRINALGVSEATITPSYAGNEKHLLVECPGVIDVQKCIATVGKTIQLEFKEEQTGATPEYEAEVRTKAQDAYAKVQSNETTLEKLGQDIGTQLGNGYQPGDWYFHSTLPKGLERLWNTAPGTVIKVEGSISQTTTDAQGAPVNEEIPGVFLAQVLQPKTSTGRIINEANAAFAILAGREPNTSTSSFDNKDVSTLPTAVAGAVQSMQPGELKAVAVTGSSAQILFLRQIVPGHEEMEASHILVAYKGASSAEPTVTRTKEEAKAKADDLKKQLDAGADFVTLALQQSDGPSRAQGGKLGKLGHGTMVAAFEQAAFALPKGGISAVVETPFGFHIIRSDQAPAQTPALASAAVLNVSGANALARAQAMQTELETGKVKQQEEAVSVRFLFFSLKPAGWKDTALDGKHFRSASVALDPTTSLPIVHIVFDSEGGRLFQELTKSNIGKRIAIFVGGELVSAPTVQGEISGGSAVITGSRSYNEAKTLAQDLNTGAIPAPIYLSGQQTVEPTLGAAALHTSLLAGLLGAIVLMIFLVLVYRLLGLVACCSLASYALIFLALLKLPIVGGEYVVFTLAGIAGMILSIGMAVDANVLVFERIKEELYRGKSLATAVELGFERAWPSVRDSNISTLITCAILFMIGTSIVRGFALTLSMGVLLSLFTGQVLTRFLARKLAKTSLAQNTKLFVWKATPKA